VWRSHIGQTVGIDKNAVVPEPATLMLLMSAMAGWLAPPPTPGPHRKSQQLVNT
jgi:hypothetical protein